MLKGVLHIHSTYSDGELTLAELREMFLGAGCGFACVTDHASAFTPDRLAAYREECAARSDDRFLFVPGLEYDCHDRMHVLGYGVTAPVESADPEVVIDHINRHGGIAVIAHPKDEAFPVIEAFEVLPQGIETWNSKYDGRFAPRPGTFALLARLRTKRPDMTAFYGQDLHWRKQCRDLFTLLDCAELNRSALLAAIRRGAYRGAIGAITLPSDGALPADVIARFGRRHAVSQQLRKWGLQLNRRLKNAGLPVPQPLKAQLRRIF